MSTSETNEMWKICAEEIIEAKCASIYESSVHLRDRHTGGKIFAYELHRLVRYLHMNFIGW